MNLDIKIQISFEGDVAGLESHHVSLHSFGPALNSFLTAYRRIVNNLLREAFSRSDARYGRLARDAEYLDLELASITGENPTSVHLEAAVRIPAGDNLLLDLGDNIYERGVVKLIDCLESESKGDPRNEGVRNYLRALPAGLRQQKYRVMSRGKLVRELTIGEIATDVEPEPIPTIDVISGNIIGVRFPPAQCEIAIKSAGSVTILLATEDQIESALNLRGVPVDAMALKRSKTKLIWLRPSDAGVRPMSHSDKLDFIDSRWAPLLDRLAK